MLPHHAPAPQPADPPGVAIGVGIDTSRYGHYAAFLRADLQVAAAELAFAESAVGYGTLRQRLEQIVARHGRVHFRVRLDAAGQYADNLLHFLQQLAVPALDAGQLASATRLATPLTHADVSISCGDPQRNKNYRVAVFGTKKSDPIEARAAARFAVSERPPASKVMPPALRTLRQVAGRLQAVVRQRTRLINQLHHLLALTFPELALLVKDIATGWVLELCHRFPTAQLLSAATVTDLESIPYLPHEHVDALLQHARTSIASLADATAAALVRDQVRQLRDASARQKRLENLLSDAYRQLPEPNHLDTIPGIGAVTAAVLTAFILDIDRFDTPGKLVAYFGVLPIEASSGVDRDGQPRGPRRYVMSRRGNDLVRRYLWMAALSAVRHNPAVRALYRRVVARHPDHKAIAIGHAMRKLLHLAFALWKSGQPFDKNHYPWDTPAHTTEQGSDISMSRNAASTRDIPTSIGADGTREQLADPAAGHTLVEPARPVVTATGALSVPQRPSADEAVYVDFAHVKAQLPLARVLDHLGLSSRLRGTGSQRRCACPIHRADGRGRTFSVNLDANVFHCFDANCAQQGDVIDLWAALHHLDLRQAALDLVHTFDLEPTPVTGTEKRQG